MFLICVRAGVQELCGQHRVDAASSSSGLAAASNAVYERTRASYTIRGFKKGEADRAQIEADVYKRQIPERAFIIFTGGRI